MSHEFIFCHFSFSLVTWGILLFPFPLITLACRNFSLCPSPTYFSPCPAVSGPREAHLCGCRLNKLACLGWLASRKGQKAGQSIATSPSCSVGWALTWLPTESLSCLFSPGVGWLDSSDASSGCPASLPRPPHPAHTFVSSLAVEGAQEAPQCVNVPWALERRGHSVCRAWFETF